MDKESKRSRSKPIKKPKKSDKLASEKSETYEELKVKEDLLGKEISALEKQGITTDLKPQMKALHDYNEMKDVTQVVLGYIADLEQNTIVELHQRFGLPTD